MSEERLREPRPVDKGEWPNLPFEEWTETQRQRLADEFIRQHVDRWDCWCGPIMNSEDPVTRVQVWVHREVVS